MRKVIVHIGQPKTGTTTLQRVLLQNRRRLRRQGFIYPKPKFGINHAGLSVIFTRHVQRSLIPRFGSDLTEARKISMTHWEAVASEILANPSATVILSSEFFYSASGLWNITQTLTKLLGEPVDTEFIAYLRTPSEHYISLVQQKLKASHKLMLPPELDIGRLQELSEIGKIRLRKFALNSMVNGDIVSDFCAIMGINDDRFVRGKRDDNKSISAEGMILLQEYRARNCADQDNTFSEGTRNFIKAISVEEARNPSRYTRPKLRLEFARWMDRDTSAVEWLRAHHGIDLSQDHGVGPSTQIDISKIQKVSELLSFDPILVSQLREAIKFTH